jgi:hypothetical protein
MEEEHIEGIFKLKPRNKLLFGFIHAGDDFKLLPPVENIGPLTASGEFQGEPATFNEYRQDVQEEKVRYFSNLLDVQSINFLSNNMLLRGEISYYEQLEKEWQYDTFSRDGLPFREEVELWPVVPSLSVTLKF